MKRPIDSRNEDAYQHSAGEEEKLDRETQEALVREAEMKLKSYASSLSPSQYGNSLDDDKYYRSDFKHPTESHSHSTYRAPPSDGDLRQYERDDPTNAYSAYNASKAGGKVSSFAGGQANGGTQNNGNFIGDRSSTRLWAPPGGQSSLSLGHDDASQSNYYENSMPSRRMESSYPKRMDTGRAYVAHAPARQGTFSLAHDEGPNKHATYNDPSRSMRYKQQSSSALRPPSTDINIRESRAEMNKFPTQSLTREDKIALAMLEEGAIPRAFKSTRDGKNFSRQSTRPW
jgi:hypothetical protein